MSRSQSQPGLADFDYSEHKAEKPDSYVDTISEREDIRDLSMGDQVWINGDTYTVICNGIGFLQAAPKQLISESGEQKGLRGGEIARTDSIGLVWASTLREKDPSDYSRSDIIAEFGEAYITTKTDDLSHVHDIVPDSNSKECNICSDSEGLPRHLEIQNNTTIAIRYCTSCNSVYRHTKEIQTNSEATLITRDIGNKQFNLTTVSGFFEVEEEDDFIIPHESFDGMHNGYRTAEYIADFLNQKMISPGINDHLQEGTLTYKTLFNLLDFERTEQSITGSETIDITDLSEIFREYFTYLEGIQDELDNFATEISKTNPETLANVLITLSKTDFHDTDQTDHDYQAKYRIKPEVINYLKAHLTGNNPAPETDLQRKVEKTYTTNRTPSDFLTSKAFYRLITETSETTVDGRVKRNHSSNIVWTDHKRKIQSHMTLTYSELQHNKLDPFTMAYKWKMDDYDMTQHFR